MRAMKAAVMHTFSRFPVHVVADDLPPVPALANQPNVVTRTVLRASVDVRRALAECKSLVLVAL